MVIAFTYASKFTTDVYIFYNKTFVINIIKIIDRQVVSETCACFLVSLKQVGCNGHNAIGIPRDCLNWGNAQRPKGGRIKNSYSRDIAE